MIYERSCDTQDWSNGAENSALLTKIHYILKYIQIENPYYIYLFLYYTIYIYMYYILDQLNVALASRIYIYIYV